MKNFLKKIAKYDGDKYLKISIAQAAPSWVSQANTTGFINNNQVVSFGSFKTRDFNMASTAASGRARTNAIRLVAQKMNLNPANIQGQVQFGQPESHFQQNQDGTITAYVRLISPLPNIQAATPQAATPQQTTQQKSPQAAQQAAPATNIEPIYPKNIENDDVRKAKWKGWFDKLNPQQKAQLNAIDDSQDYGYKKIQTMLGFRKQQSIK